jgi:hypothetical protein
MPDSIRRSLRLEAFAVFAFSVLAYHRLGGSWGWFAVLFFAPDAAMLGYLRGPVVGARLYNLAHTYATPALVAAVSLASGWSLSWATLWAAHIGFDRMLGYGLKYETAFTDTHLGTIGRSRA